MGVLRLALAISVLLGHSGGHGFFGLAFLDRQLAVESFFIISGFYMALVLNEKYLGPGRYWTFIQQRFLRLYPTYFILMIAILCLDVLASMAWDTPFASVKAWADNRDVLTPEKAALFATVNLTILGQDLASLLTLDHFTGQLSFFHHGTHPYTVGHMFLLNRPSWSLAVEFCFYLVAPFIVCRSWKSQLGVLLASVASRFVFAHYLGQQTPWNYTFFPPNLGYFVAGSIAYIFYRDYRPLIETLLPKLKWAFLVFGLIILTYNRLPYRENYYVVLIPLVCVMVPLLFTATRDNRTDRLIGELSYPFYLIHQHVLMYTDPLENRFPVFYGPGCVVLTTLLAWLFYRYIETKTEHFREDIYRRSKARDAASLESAVRTDPSTSSG